MFLSFLILIFSPLTFELFCFQLWPPSRFLFSFCSTSPCIWGQAHIGCKAEEGKGYLERNSCQGTASRRCYDPNDRGYDPLREWWWRKCRRWYSVRWRKRYYQWHQRNQASHEWQEETYLYCLIIPCLRNLTYLYFRIEWDSVLYYLFIINYVGDQASRHHRKSGLKVPFTRLICSSTHFFSPSLSKDKSLLK